tara:strand:- start:88 stop:564 length:477 start_codon:yes stop_codon:yes gene_type:complete
MKTKFSVFFLVLGLTILIFFPVLYNDVLISQSFSLENKKTLTKNDTIYFAFSQKENVKINMNIFFRINQDYKQYSNLFFFTYLINTELNDTISIDTLQYLIYDKFGQCLGSGPSDIKTFEKNYKENYILKKGNYSLSIIHGMNNDIQGLQNISLKINK